MKMAIQTQGQPAVELLPHIFFLLVGRSLTHLVPIPSSRKEADVWDDSRIFVASFHLPSSFIVSNGRDFGKTVGMRPSLLQQKHALHG